jgi:hypothetical protein
MSAEKFDRDGTSGASAMTIYTGAGIEIAMIEALQPFDCGRRRPMHVQAIIVAIDQYAEAATGNRDFFLTKPPSARRNDVP